VVLGLLGRDPSRGEQRVEGPGLVAVEQVAAGEVDVMVADALCRDPRGNGHAVRPSDGRRAVHELDGQSD
jgi:hypothetical protein